jgi:Carboxypeptidase regulatory-like domain
MLYEFSHPRKVLQFAFMLFLASSAFAQTNEGSIVGNIFDPSGAVVPNATITATSKATGGVYHAVSTSAGSFNIGNVRIGTYDVSVNAPGFQTNEIQGVVVQIATQSTLKVTLQTGNVTQTVTVDAEAPTIQSESSDIGAVVTTKQVLDLPLALGSSVQAMRSPEAFVFLVPGTVGPGTNGATQTAGVSEGGPFESKVTGGQNYGTEVLLDGASTYRSENGSSFDEAAPSVEALSEFRVETSTMPAEYGRTTGGIEIFSTKSGGNDFHGTAYDIFRNKDLDANTWYNNYQGLPRILDSQNDYGGVLSGPVWIPHLYNGKNKTFFMFSWEQYRQTVGFSSTSTVPTAAERSGDFTADLNTAQVVGTNPCDGTPVYFGEIFDPATTRTGAGGVLCRTSYLAETGKNAIPTAQQSSIAQKLLSFYPAPTNSNAINNLTYNGSYPLLDTTMTIRIDQNISDKHKFFAMYDSRDNNRLSNSPSWGNAASPGGPSQDFFTHFARAGEDWTISPTMLNHVNLGFNHTNSANYAAGVRLGNGTNWDAALGITNVSGTTFPAINTGQPNISTLGDTNFGDTIDYGYRFNDTFDWVKSKHTFKFGVDYRYQIFEPGTFSNTTGSFNFGCAETAAAAGPLASCASSGNGVASLLLGQVDNATAAAYASQPQWRSHYYALFAQDSFKVTPTFTLNYGIRWEVDAPRYEVHGDTSDISLTAPNPAAGGRPGALVFAGTGPGRNGVVDETWANTWHKDVAPRIGFAWAPAQFNNKLAIRGGYAIYYGAITYADFGADLQDGFTALPSFSSTNGFSPAFNIGAGFPAYPAPPSLDPTLANFAGNPTNAYIDPSYGRPAMVNNWSFDVQSQLATDLILDVGYVGQHSTHLRSNIDPINNLNPAYFPLGTTLTESLATAGVPEPFPGFGTGRQVAEALLPYPQFFALNTDCCLEDLGQSSYDAMEVSLQRRFHAGLNLMASYTWSKTLTDADSTLPYFANLAGGGAIQNPFDLKNEKSVSNQDIPQNFVLSYIYELPIGKNKKWLNKGGISNVIFGGWSVSGIQTYHSGQPEAFCCATGIPYFDGAIRYNYVAGQSVFSPAFLSGNYNPVTTPIFNKAAFEDPNSAANVALYGYRLGDMSRTDPAARSFFYKSEDFNVLKRTHLTERVDILFQMSFLDAFNRHIFDNHVSVDLNPTDAQFGVMNPGATIMGPRRIQLQMKLEF